MRYTTIIDLSEYPHLYRSESIRLLYMHLCLKSGYHDDDRDLIDISLRRLAIQTGLTVAAVRHALAQLQKYDLLQKQGPLWQVRKFVLEKPISKRAQSRRQEQQQQAAQIREEESKRRESERQQYQDQAAAMEKKGKTPFMVYFESLQEKARGGDPEAANLVKMHQSVYDQHAAALAERRANKSKKDQE